jgi:hypothetical protein
MRTIRAIVSLTLLAARLAPASQNIYMVEWKPLPGIPNRRYPYDWNRILSGLLVILWLGILASELGSAVS